MPQVGQVVHQSSVLQLCSFCRGEMAARDSYKLALSDPVLAPHRETLTRCLESHQKRVEILGEEIERVGGKVPKFSGPWGAMVDILERAAMKLGLTAAVTALREGEDHGLRDYRADIPKLDWSERKFVETYILPEQIETQRAITSLANSIS